MWITIRNCWLPTHPHYQHHTRLYTDKIRGSGLFSTTWSIVTNILIGFLLLALLAGLVYFLSWRTQAARQRQLKKEARRDYQQARGTQHRQLLRRGRTKMVVEQQRQQEALQHAKQELKRQQRQRDDALEARLPRWLIENHFHEIPGLGKAMRDDIVARVFYSRLQDLHDAYRCQGVGPRKQIAISRWVYEYEIKMEVLQQHDFPGKAEVLAKYQQPIKAQKAQVTRLVKKKARLDRRLARIEETLAWLQAVEESDFIKAYCGADDAPHDKVEAYLRGVFAEWEPEPRWFREARKAQEA